MTENLHMAHKKQNKQKRPQKTLCVHSARYTQCIQVSSSKLKLPKHIHTNNVQTAPIHPPHPLPKGQLYIAVKW